MDISYILNEYAEDRENYYNAVTPPIALSSNFVFKTVDGMRQAFYDEYSTYHYSRARNPTVEILRKKLAALDGAEDCLVFSSGAAAIFASVLANVKSGDHIVSVDKPYTWAQKLFNHILPRFNISVSYIDGRYIENFEKAILPNTTLIYLESPNSWDFALQDLEAVAKLARAKNILTICDNSYCTPVYQKPLAFGIDLCLQSGTKYLGGHSDVLAGVVSGSTAMIRKIFNSEYLSVGSGIQPFNAWLLIRGLRTLTLRLQRISATTKIVVAFLKTHPIVEKVISPWDEDFDQAELARKQMKDGFGLLTFFLKPMEIARVELFCESLQHILMAVSWGGHESLIIPRCASIAHEDYDISDPSHRMIRLYCGLEEPSYIIDDLKQAFSML